MPNPILDWMSSKGIPVTRSKFIELNWGLPTPKPWTAELEAELPEELQDWSQFKQSNGELVLKSA